ncbi:sensor histidine kinase [Ornithinimicrobium avium]|uniref:histidine kinase n=1 Tax=Ornithinimicrobium avium TaxID=2283195 RepID=A0A345NLF1_9MICO|nr:HAMP domain-containing sensor histidine kinase [Ornithinimicrobium avium]AXH95859.1 sensor histidine kinase [Ornithinimicrobium avium]
MREVLRELALRVLLVVTGVVAGTTGLVVWILVALEERLGPVPLWALLLTVVGGSLATVGAVAWALRPLADRTAEVVADPLRRLAHRTDEMASGGFALDPQTRPGRLVEPPPWRGGIREIDAVAREIDRHHSTFARALVSERSFAADASHQLRTPLAALLLRLEEIAQAEDAAVARTEAEIAIGQVERLTGVVAELLRRTRVGHASGGALSAVDHVLAGLDEEWTPAFAEQEREIVLSSERGIIVEASAPAVSQVLNTLVENALVHGRGRVEVHVGRSGPSAVFTVADQGAGIPDQMARSVFERAVTTGSGTGLGLAVARETAETMGGRLELTRVRPPVFSLYLPLATTP